MKTELFQKDFGAEGVICLVAIVQIAAGLFCVDSSNLHRRM